MNISNYINASIESLKSKAVVASNRVKSRVLSSIDETPSRINSAIDSVRSNIGSKLQNEKLQMQNFMESRQREFDTAKINFSNRLKQPIDPNSTMGKFGINIQNLNEQIRNLPILGQIAQIPEKYGTMAGEQIGAGIKQLQSGTPSNLMGKNIPSYIAGPAKIALGGFGLTPAGVAGSYAYEGSKGLGDKVFGKDSFGAEGLGLVGAILAPGDFKGDIAKSQKLLKGLEKESTKFSSAEDFINKSPEAQKVFQKWFDNVWLKSQPLKVQEKWSKNFNSDMAMSAGVQVKEEIYQKVFSPLLKNVYNKANGIKTTLETMGKDKNVMTGLFNESPAQTAMRRKAKISPNEIYHGAIDTIRTTENKIKNTGARVVDSFDQMMKDEAIPPQNKVNIFNYLSSPSKVLDKIGLGEQAKAISRAWDGYQLQLPKELDKISAWMARTPETGAEVRIFDYLDGKARLNSLLPEEQKVAGEMKDYLKMWADKLGLPEDSRIGNYITHLFPKGAIEKEFDPEIARAIDSKVPSSIWNPFKQKRTNIEGYSRDVYQALQAYSKRATRQSFVEGPLKALSEASEKLDSESYKYVQKVTANLNMRPAEIDNLIDTFIKSTPVGYKLTARPWAYITHALREATYKGALGLNISSATRNISQLNNSYALLGEKAFFKGGIEFVQKLAKKDLDELYTVGVLNDSFITDRNLSVFKKSLQKVDDGLWSLFSFSEKVNRGISYYGSKGKALSEGKTTQEAIEIAKNFVAKTQFKFGPMDLPAVFMSDTAKLFGQFQSYNVRQGEFLVDLVKDKNWPAIARYVTGNLIFINLIGKAFGMTWQEMIPFSGVATGQTKLGQTPAVSGISGVAKIASGYAFGNDEQIESGKKDLSNSVASFIPAGVQLKKIYNGIKANMQGGVYTKSDNLRFPTENKLQNVLFGPNVSKTAQAYYDNPQPLSENQTEVYKALISAGMAPKEAYSAMTQNRGTSKKIDEAIAGDKSFNLFDFIKGSKKEVTVETQKDGLFGYLQRESQQTEQNKILSEIFSKTSTPEEAQKAIDAMGLGVTYQEAMIQMVKSLEVDNRSEYLFEEMSKLSNEEFGKSLQAFVENKVITNSVIDSWNETGKISDEKAKSLKQYIQLKLGKKITGGKSTKRFKINGRIKRASSKLKLPTPKFAPLKPIKTPKLNVGMLDK